MNKTFLSLFFLFLAPICVAAQDIIKLHNGEEIQAKILEVLPEEVKYKMFDYQDGPTITLPNREIQMITYQSGLQVIVDHSLPPGMKYKELQQYYSPSGYHRLPGDRYSRARCLLNLLLPGLGQMTMGEVERGAAFLFGTYGSLAVGGTVGALLLENRETQLAGIMLIYTTAIASYTGVITSIVDAVKVAKVKNLYYRDLNGRYSSIDIQCSPYVAPAMTNDGLRPSAGLALCIKF